MEFEAAQEKFIQAWGTLGSNWGINRTMSQIHALLMSSLEPLSAEEIMEGLNISRGNSNMNLRALIEWGLVEKVLVFGERKEYFKAEKDITRVAKQIAKERRRRELEPVLKTLDELKSFKASSKEAKAFKAVIKDLEEYTSTVDSLMSKFIRSDRNWFYKTLMKLVR